MTGFYCPLEGCDKHHDEWNDDQPPFDDISGVRGHISAKPDDDHLEARDQGAWVEAPEAGSFGDDEGDEEADDPPLEEGETQDEEADDHPDEGGEEAPEGDPEEETMVEPTEYDQQQTQQTRGGEADDDPTDEVDDQPTGGLPTPSTGGIPPSTVFLVMVGVFAAIVIWRVWRSRADATEPTIDVDEDDESSRGLPSSKAND